MDTATGLLNQFRKPTGWFGRLNLASMNRRHSRLTDWGLARVTIGKEATILDVGCGGGRTVSKLAALAPGGSVCGVDYSDASVASSRKTNKRAIQAGRVDIRHASVSDLPFAADMFDLVTAVETHFYWPDLPADLREVLRVLKRGGALLIIAEAYKGGRKARQIQMFADRMSRTGSYSHLTVEEHRELLASAGYSDVQVFEDYERGWMCARGTKAV
jgi:ubiquinone/menaquinone biosynthesis C-methylase UbiE